MMHILILAAGQAHLDMPDGSYPLCLTERNGVPLIEQLMKACPTDSRFIVALREQDIRRYHLDNVIGLLAPDAHILHVSDGTRGAACTALLAAGHIDNDHELLILNGNELLTADFSPILADFRARGLDAGCVTFPSVHPRYSYVRVNRDQYIVEAAEKNPISRLATAGFYWFARGRDFVRAAQNMIRKDASVKGLFYICPTLNQLVLEQAKIGIHTVDADHYHPLKTERQLMHYATLDTKKVL